MTLQKSRTLPHLLVIGGGTAGIGVIASLKKRLRNLQITVVDPSENHYYQPGWTLVGGGLYDNQKTIRPLREVLPSDVSWVQESVTAIDPVNKLVTTESGKQMHYDFLVIACEVVLRWDKIEGLEETLGRNGVTSNYRPGLAPYTWQLASTLSTGNALFCQPMTPFKCAGAPRKALYLPCEHCQRKGGLRH